MKQSTFSKIIWYIKHPKYYSELVSQTINFLESKIFPYKSNQRLMDQIENEKISVKDALIALFNISENQIEKIDQDIVEQAKQKANNCPLPMGGAAGVDLLYNIARLSNCKYALETGVSLGWSSLALLSAIEKNNIHSGETSNEIKLISTDKPYPFDNIQNYVGIVVPKKLSKSWEIIKTSDRIAIPRIKKISQKNGKKFDIIHYDSDKSAKGRSWAYPRLYSMLKKGGYFISDDISDNDIFIKFCKKISKKPTIVFTDNRYVGIFRK